MPSLPAHATKQIQSLTYPHLGHTFHLTQSDDGHSNGTTLWLGAQILSLYVVYHLKRPSGRPRAVELGSGVGLTALVLSTLGYDVLATDTAHVCDSVLRHNITTNLPHLPTPAGCIQVRELDWNVESDRWRWNDPMRITHSGDSTECGTNAAALLRPPFDLIISSDTLYDMSLVHPFFRTVQSLMSSDVLLIAIERRDPQLMEDALKCSPVPLMQVPKRKIRKAMARAGIRWESSDWDGVEIWSSRK